MSQKFSGVLENGWTRYGLAISAMEPPLNPRFILPVPFWAETWPSSQPTFAAMLWQVTTTPKFLVSVNPAS